MSSRNGRNRITNGFRPGHEPKIPPGGKVIDISAAAERAGALSNLQMARNLRAAVDGSLREAVTLLEELEAAGDTESETVQALTQYRGALEGGMESVKSIHRVAVVRAMKANLETYQVNLEDQRNKLGIKVEDEKPADGGAPAEAAK